MNRTLIGSGLLLALAVSLGAQSLARIGQSAPQFRAETIDGRTIASEDFRGKVVLLNFWGTY